MTLNLHIREEERYRGSLLPKDKAQRPKARLHAMNDIVENELFDDEDDEDDEDDGNDDIKAISTSSSEHYDNTASRKTPLDGIHYDIIYLST